MSLIDWLIVVIPVLGVMGVGWYAKRYIHGVADFLASGRVCGRYVISVGDIANALSIIGLVAYVEIHYKTGFALAFWQYVTGPITIMMGLFGYCHYRFRETGALSLGQFLEMRYNRKLRIFAASLRSLSEMLANMIMPAIAARFFIYYIGFPNTIKVLGLNIPTFMVIVVICLSMAIGLICMGGNLVILITDAIQGMLCFPLITIFVVFILTKFSWSKEIVPVMIDRAPGESFLNPYDISNLRDFNLFMVVLLVFNAFMHRASWIGAGTSTSAKSPHEQKMAGLLGAFRASVSVILYVVIAIMIITLMNHRDFAPRARVVRNVISTRISQELVPDDSQRADFDARIAAVPELIHQIGVDPPLSQDDNLDNHLLEVAHEALKEFEGESLGNAKFQQYRTLFHQMMMAGAMRELLPPVMTGLFCLLMILAMVSTDDTRIFSATITLTQDVVMPLRKTPFTPKQHMLAIRLVAIGIGVFFFCGSFFMAQLDYINLFVNLMTNMWMGGCGPLMIFGLYGRFGTTAGAFTSLISGMLLSFFSIFVQRNWAAVVYPWLERMGWVDGFGRFLEKASAPFNPYIVWKMDPVKFPINSYEIYFMTMIVTTILFIVVSKLTMKEPFNLDRLLHRGKYNLEGTGKDERTKWSFGTMFTKMIGITPEYTRGDKFIAWAFFLYSFVYGFLIVFVGVIIWNAISPWPTEWWAHYFYVVTLIVPAVMAAISTFWFGIGGAIDLYRLFRDLKIRERNHLDCGWVEGSISLQDVEAIDAIEQKIAAEDGSIDSQE